MKKLQHKNSCTAKTHGLGRETQELSELPEPFNSTD